MVAGIRLEPASLSLRPPRETFSNVDHTRIFNADIAILDDQAVHRPYLVEALPALNTDTWRVQPDGRMQTTYRFRPNLTWHDGAPLTTEDFVFAFQVYSTPDVGLSRQPPFDAIEQVEAIDPRTMVIHWKRLYPDAAHMTGRDRNFPPLPRQVLQAPFASESVDAFLTLPYWSRDFVSTGPFKVVNWEPGTFIEAAAFDGHTTGRPKIDRMKITFIPDNNTALASMLGGELHLASATTLNLTQSVTLKQDWEPRQAGTVFYQVFVWHGLSVQFLPGRSSPRTLTDVRVRRALAHAIDKPGINDAINAGIALEADFYLPPNGQWGAEVQRGAVKHPLDLRLSEQLMREVGYEKAPDGVYVSQTEGRFVVEARTVAGSAVPELAALANDWRTAGFEVNQHIVPAALALDLETKAGYPGMYLTTTPATERTVVSMIPGNIPTPENGWRGGSQISWTHPAYTRLVEQFGSTLDRSERGQQMEQMARIYSEDLATISLHFPPLVWANTSSLKGPKEGPPDTNVFWNIQEWELFR